jgi:hypothetical protein
MDKKNDINTKSSPIQMREMMKRVREGGFTANESKESPKDLSVRDMLKITREINEGLDERTPEPINTENLSGEELLKSKYGTLAADIQFNKLAQAYENYLQIKRNDFEPSGVLQKALSAARDLIAEYLRNVRGLNVSGEDVQNFFHTTLNKFNSVVNEDVENKETVYDQSMEEEKFRNFFNDMNVSIKLIDLEIYDNLVFWGGTIDGVIQFIYKVTPDESTSGVEFNYLEDFSPDNPENEEITGRIESYFDNFYKYWRDNVMNTDSAINDEK